MSTFALLWDGHRHTLEVLSVAEMLSRNRSDYTEDLPAHAVPLLIGTAAEVTTARDCCLMTVLRRREAAERARAVIDAAGDASRAHFARAQDLAGGAL